MLEQKTNSKVGRDQYNISGDKAKLKVDNRSNADTGGKLVGKFILGIAAAVAAGLLLYYVFGIK